VRSVHFIEGWFDGIAEVSQVHRHDSVRGIPALINETTGRCSAGVVASVALLTGLRLAAVRND